MQSSRGKTNILRRCRPRCPGHSIIILCTSDILQNIEFTWVTGHKGLEHVLTQWILSGRQVHGWRSCQASTSLNSICLPVRRMLSQMHNYTCMGMTPWVLYERPQNLLKITGRRKKYLVLWLSRLPLSSPLSSLLDQRSWL